MIFATDLDNTMIFSYRLIQGIEENNLCCVEYYKGKPLTYMTYSSLNKLKKIMEQVTVIPVTTRSISQFHRVNGFPSCKYSITTNGGVILENGIANPLWDSHINHILKKYDLEATCQFLLNYPNLSLEVKIVDNTFIFGKCTDIDLCKKVLQNEFNSHLWTLSFNGIKFYLIPKDISKGNALKFVCETLIHDSQTIIAAGDSNLDLSMLEYSTYGIIPTNCNLSAENNGFFEVETNNFLADKILDLIIYLSAKN